MGTLTASLPPRIELEEELTPESFGTGEVILPPEYPPLNMARVAELVRDIAQHGQNDPGHVGSDEAAKETDPLLCFDGGHRLEACKQLGIAFRAFRHKKPMGESERHRFTFQQNFNRRKMPKEEIVWRATRVMELEGFTAKAAAQFVGISPPALSRALGEKRIPPELMERVQLLIPSIRPLIAAARAPDMAKAVAYAETPRSDGKRRTRDEVAAFISDLKHDGGRNGGKPKTVPLHINGRVVTLSLSQGDTYDSVAEDLAALLKKLGKHSEVEPEGWAFLFR